MGRRCALLARAPSECANCQARLGLQLRNYFTVGAIVALATDEIVPAPLEGTHGRGIVTRQRLESNLLVNQVSDRAIEFRRVCAFEHHRQIVAVLPVSLAAQLCLYELMETRAG